MEEVPEIHPTHMPEADDKRLYADLGYVACMRCCYFIKLASITPRGLEPCEPMKIGLRDIPSLNSDILAIRIEAMGFPVLGREAINDIRIHW